MYLLGHFCRQSTKCLCLVPQRLEESVLSEEKRLTVRGPSPDAPPTCLPARVREIVTKNLTDSSESPRSALPSHRTCVSTPFSLPNCRLCPSSLPAPGAMSSVMSLQEENRVLQGELARLEDLLAHSRADRDELAIKYGAISERVRQDTEKNKKATTDGNEGRTGGLS